ncbi:hypothetical protein ACCS33_07475 [Rhizobium ruizarguesonis]|uniref:hypothetical protein n=1 Tax=Rhizobium ruizarguesonis TaxID=2081791 RepID=UPI0013B7530F|nr:hypothetical protein [Rhizobium ruizarguesonis]NEI07813.1 hypothetical protein [Rhizobium ruizarguesonis]
MNHEISLYWYDLFNAKSLIEALFSSSVYHPHLRISRHKAYELRDMLERYSNPKNFTEGYRLTDFDIWSLKSTFEQFRTVFVAEIAALPSYLITQKENYDTERLIDSGIGLFPWDLTTKVPQSINDAMECGRCLAYEVYTACGFHTFRIVEAVLRKYWLVVSKEEVPKPGTIGFLAAELKKKALGDEKVWESLQQLSKLHRNPLTHAEVLLSRDEALGTIGMARSVMTAMLGYIPPEPSTGGQSTDL